ncbi:MAG: hypothetical protein K8L99_18080, partial [Anaerolineae bacterium]|nr:hypothetical protein [Anaerolineae bacterium]
DNLSANDLSTVQMDEPKQKTAETKRATVPAPWLLQQFMAGQFDEISVEAELNQRFPSMPVMSTFNSRVVDDEQQHGVATLATQDAAALLLVDVDRASRLVQFSFTFRSMLTLRYQFTGLSDKDRERWLESMRDPENRLAFLWGQRRWESNYLMCVTHKYHTNLYAFSPQHFESAARLTLDVAQKLVDWLEDFWNQESSEKPLISW